MYKNVSDHNSYMFLCQKNSLTHFCVSVTIVFFLLIDAFCFDKFGVSVWLSEIECMDNFRSGLYSFSDIWSSNVELWWISWKLDAGRKAQSASKIWENMQEVERKAQRHDAKLE
jgi:hypothetical protein